MNVLAEILSSKGRSEFFRLLFGLGSNEYHLREIERRSGLAIGTIRQEAGKLERLGLVRKRRDGNRTYYSADNEHPLYSTIHDLVLKTSGLAHVLQQALSIEGISIAFVFGSLAAGQERSQSDVDLFVLGDIGFRTLSRVLKEPTQLIGREINSHIMTEAEFIRRRKENEHFVAHVLGSPKLMIRGDEDELKRLGQ